MKLIHLKYGGLDAYYNPAQLLYVKLLPNGRAHVRFQGDLTTYVVTRDVAVLLLDWLVDNDSLNEISLDCQMNPFAP